MSPSELLTVETLLACIGPDEACTRAQIMQRVSKGTATVQYVINRCVASGALRCSRKGRHHVWCKCRPATCPAGPRGEILRGYDRRLRQFSEICMAARPPAPPGQVVRHGGGWQ